jgi:hypothetical protein
MVPGDRMRWVCFMAGRSLLDSLALFPWPAPNLAPAPKNIDEAASREGSPLQQAVAISHLPPMPGGLSASFLVREPFTTAHNSRPLP